MTPHLFDHLLVAVLALGLPVEAVLAYRTLLRGVAAGRADARVRAYRRAIVVLWGLTAVLLAGWAALGRTPAALGFGLPSDLLEWGFLGAGALLSGLLLLQVRGLRDRPDDLAQLREQMEELRPLLPADDRELRWFSGLSVTAGITEEVLYRGFLITYLVPFIGVVPAVLLAAILFGAGHLYQGPSGVLKAALVGLVLGALFAVSGQLWAPILLHAAIDLSSGTAARAAAEG